MSDADDEMYDLQDTKISKDKVNALGSEIMLSVKIDNEEWITLLSLADAESSKSLGNEKW